jgi:cell division protein ZipA
MELRYALLLIGLIIVAVVVFHTLDFARLRRRLRHERPAAATAATPPRVEPVAGIDFNPPRDAVSGKRALAPDADVRMPSPATAQDPITAELETLEEVATMPLNLKTGGLRKSSAGADLGRPALPDEKIDFIMRLPADAVVARDEALGVYKQHEYELDKPHRLYGCRADSDMWSELQHDSKRMSYGDLALSIQLVDARGPIDDSELHKFSQVGLSLADALHRRTQFAIPYDEALARARELQQFCETFDVIAAVHVVAPQGQKFKGRMLEHAARKLGMQWGARSIFHMKNEFSPGCRHLFSLANLSGNGEFPAGQWDSFETAGVTFFMSVPCAHRPAPVFDKMIAAAQLLAETLRGELHDQTHKPLTAEGIAVIRRQIETIDEQMRAQSIVPGSQTALRLFADETVD